MSLLAADNLHLSFGPKTILAGAGFMLDWGDRVGVVGPNGTGKSTLMRIITGTQPLDDGQLHFARGARLGYLPQDVLEMGGGTVLSSVLAAVPGKGDIEMRLVQAEQELKETDDPDRQMELSQRIVDLHEQIERFETEYGTHEAERILMGLGFEVADFDRPIAELSGGWKMRAALAGLLFKKPDLLLLDEPTNHLDVPTVAWLDEFMRNFKQTLMLISHDRAFLNRQVGRVLSFEVEGLRAYTGNYDQYLQLRDQELEVRRAARRNQEAEIRQSQQFIRRFRAKSTKARQVQSRIKKLEKMELVEVDHERASVSFSFPPTTRTGKVAIGLRGIAKSFGDLHLYDDLTLNAVRGDRIAIIGRNGAGKTTLLRLMAGELPVDAGEIEYGANVELAYYAQHHTEKLDPNRSILDEVWRIVPSMSQTAVRNVCGAFLFSGDEVDKGVGVLSGGERARVSLARLLVKPGNVLLMDEPTNHLDLLSSEALAEALDTFDGTLIFVSHNRAFINRLANKIWDIERGKVHVFPGNLDDYLYHLEQTKKREAQEEPDETEAEPDDEAPAEKITDYQQRKRIQRKRSYLERDVKKAEADVAKLEERIGKMETKLGELEGELAKPDIYDDADTYNKLLGRYQETKEKIEQLTARWEHRLAESEKLKADLDALPNL